MPDNIEDTIKGEVLEATSDITRLEKILEQNGEAISRLTDQVTSLVENANRAISIIPKFEEAHVKLATQLEDSLKLDKESLQKIEAILERVEGDTRESTKSVIKHTLISSANAKFVSGTVAIIAVLFLVWGQLSPESRRLWADKTFPIVGTFGMGLIGYLLYGKVPNEIDTRISATTATNNRQQ